MTIGPIYDRFAIPHQKQETSTKGTAMPTNSLSRTRRSVFATVVIAGALSLALELVQAPQAATPPTMPEGSGSVSGAPDLPKGFTGMFTSRYISG
jgi:hypothetical protein